VRSVAGEEMMESRLRELLHDPGWSLPPWPDAEARVRRTARRQRIRAATAGAAVAGIVAAVVATVTGFQSPGALGPYGGQGTTVALPGPGAAGFPLSIYPPALPGLTGGRFTRCPDPDGLTAATPAAGARATAVVASLDATRFSTDLRSSDRAYWPQEQADRRAAAAPGQHDARVVYSGPLTSAGRSAADRSAADRSAAAAGGAAASAAVLSRAIVSSCGSRTARDTWLVITAAPERPGGQSEFLLVDRRGHMLVWDST
jgi:hypothetical protein